MFVILLFTAAKVNSDCLEMLFRTSGLLSETSRTLKETTGELLKVRAELEALKNQSNDYTTVQPTTSKPQNSPVVYECMFENISACGYSKNSQDGVEWVIGNGQVGNNTGPKTDHTFGNKVGKYLFIDGLKEAKKPSHLFDFLRKANVEFPTIVPNNASEFCISFWYSMFGKDVKTLKFYVHEDGINRLHPVFTKEGNQGPDWQHFQYELPERSAKFAFSFTATTRAYSEMIFDANKQAPVHNEECNIAIDDIEVTSSSCIYPSRVNTKSPIIG